MAAPRTQAEMEAYYAQQRGLLPTPAAHPSIGRKTLPATYYEPQPPPVSDIESSDSEESTASPSSDSCSECSSSDDHHHTTSKRHHKKKKHSKRERRGDDDVPLPMNKKQRGNVYTDHDAQLIAPLQFMRYLQDRQNPKACGRCAECKKPPCGTCKACIQNAKRTAEISTSDPEKRKKNLKDHRRCEALRCEKDKSAANVPYPTGVPEDREELAEALAKTAADLAEAGAKSGTPDFDRQAYQALVSRMKSLREGLAILKNRKARYVLFAQYNLTPYPQSPCPFFGWISRRLGRSFNPREPPPQICKVRRPPKRI